MYSNNIIMSIKNVFITSGMTFLFGVYSLYNILDYLNNIDRIYNHKLLDLQRKLVETDKHYNNLYFDFIKIKNEVDFLSSKIVIIEKKLTERPLYCFSPNFDYYESSEDDKKSNESKNIIRITSENNNLEPNNVLLNENIDENVNKIIDENVNKIIDENVNKSIDENVNKIIDENIDELVNKITEYDCVEIVNIADINTIQVSDCSSRKNSLTNSNLNLNLNLEKEPLYKSRSASISDVNWGGLMKTFLLG